MPIVPDIGPRWAIFLIVLIQLVSNTHAAPIFPSLTIVIVVVVRNLALKLTIVPLAESAFFPAFLLFLGAIYEFLPEFGEFGVRSRRKIACRPQLDARTRQFVGAGLGWRQTLQFVAAAVLTGQHWTT